MVRYFMLHLRISVYQVPRKLLLGINELNDNEIKLMCLKNMGKKNV